MSDRPLLIRRPHDFSSPHAHTPHELDLDLEWGGLCKPYPDACRALLEFIQTARVTVQPPASACQAVARRLALDDVLMRDPIARDVVESYLAPPAPKTTPRARR